MLWATDTFVVSFEDSAGNDIFVSKSSTSRMRGDGFLNIAKDFATVQANATPTVDAGAAFLTICK